MKGLGLSWRPELALAIERDPRVAFVEVTAEDVEDKLPTAVEALKGRKPIVVHGLTLSLGGAEPPRRERLKVLARLARKLDAVLVSEHVAFTRAGGLEAGHLLPVGRTRAALEVVVENVKRAQDALPVPLALENVASLFQWPDAEIPEAGFMAELVERTGALLLLDIANVHANCANHGWDPNLYLRSLPLERLAYVHIAGGVVAGGLYRDTHRHAITPEVLGLLTRLCELRPEPGVLLEWDDDFPPPAELGGQLDSILEAVAAAGGPVGAD